jgi:hypothetical protein
MAWGLYYSSTMTQSGRLREAITVADELLRLAQRLGADDLVLGVITQCRGRRSGAATWPLQASTLKMCLSKLTPCRTSRSLPCMGGADGHLVRAAVDHGAKGIVIQGLGWGNVNLPMFTAIKEAIAKGVPVVITSRVPNGRVLPNYGFEGGGKTLVEAGAVMGDDLSPQKARILLMLLLQNATMGQKELQAAFSGP